MTFKSFPVIAVALLAAAPVFAAEVTEIFDQTVSLSPGGTFDLSNVNGRVTIKGWDRNDVRIHAVKSAKTKEALREVEVEVSGSGDKVTVRTHLPKGRNVGGSVAYEIQAPATAHIVANTVNGQLEIAQIKGNLDVKTVNGTLNVDQAASNTNAETVNGALTVRFAAVPESGDMKLSSVNGSVRLVLPMTAAGAFDAQTVNGSITTDFPLEVKKARFGPTSSLAGTIGSGGAHYHLETVNGSIRIFNTKNTDAGVR